MNTTKTKSFLSLKGKMSFFIVLAFIPSTLYLLYLACVSRILMYHDSIGYEGVGRLLYEKGWLGFFTATLQREPVYPFITSLAIHLGDFLLIPYLFIQKFFQILILVLTQFLMLKILRKLKINDFLIAVTILYIGFSPSIVNSTLRLYSEIAAYPFLLVIILLGCSSWKSLYGKNSATPGEESKSIVFYASLLGFSFVLATLARGIFEAIGFIFIIPYIIFAVAAFVKKEKKLFKNSVLFLGIFFIVFYGCITAYKAVNKKYNGHFAITGRGSYALYGNITRRMQPLTAMRLKTALAYACGHRVCKVLYGEDACEFWHFTTSDDFGYPKRQELTAKMSPDEADRTLVVLALKKMVRNPFQAVLFMAVETIKMIFWELKSMAYVVYPRWLAQLYEPGIFYYALSFLMASLTISALFYFVRFLCVHQGQIFSLKRPPETPVCIMSCIFMLLGGYMGVHSFFFVAPRYVFPIVSVYLILIAFLAQNTLFRKSRKNFSGKGDYGKT